MGDDVVDLVGRHAGVAHRLGHRHRVAPRPVGSGAEMWNASAVSAAPMTSAWMVAPRASACSADSTTTTPAPSPNRNPSRSRSNGREARSGRRCAWTARPCCQRGEADRQQRRLRAARQDDVDLAALDHPQARPGSAMTRAGARGDLGDDRAGQAVLHRQLAGGHGARQGRDRERADLARALRAHHVGAVDDLLHAAAAGVDATATRSRRSGLQSLKSRPGVRDRFLAGGHGEVDEAAHPAGHLAVHRDRRVEVLDLGRDAHVEAGRVEAGDRSAAADTPATRLRQNVGWSLPMGVTAPMPVTTARRERSDWARGAPSGRSRRMVPARELVSPSRCCHVSAGPPPACLLRFAQDRVPPSEPAPGRCTPVRLQMAAEARPRHLHQAVVGGRVAAEFRTLRRGDVIQRASASAPAVAGDDLAVRSADGPSCTAQAPRAGHP